MRDFSCCSSGSTCVHPQAGFLTEDDYLIQCKDTGKRNKKCRKCLSARARAYVIKKGLTGKGTSRRMEQAELERHTWDYKMASSYITSGFL